MPTHRHHQKHLVVVQSPYENIASHSHHKFPNRFPARRKNKKSEDEHSSLSVAPNNPPPPPAPKTKLKPGKKKCQKCQKFTPISAFRHAAISSCKPVCVGCELRKITPSERKSHLTITTNSPPFQHTTHTPLLHCAERYSKQRSQATYTRRPHTSSINSVPSTVKSSQPPPHPLPHSPCHLQKQDKPGPSRIRAYDITLSRVPEKGRAEGSAEPNAR